MSICANSVCVVLKGWPRLSETFIAQELVGLERRGLTLNLFSLRHPTDKATHALHAQLEAPVAYLPEGKDRVLTAYSDTVAVVTKTSDELVKTLKQGYETISAKISGETVVTEAAATVKKTVKKTAAKAKKAAKAAA